MNDFADRVQFEYWVTGKGWDIAKDGTAYASRQVSEAWAGWCACATVMAREVKTLHHAQSLNNQNHPAAWHEAIDAALDVIHGEQNVWMRDAA